MISKEEFEKMQELYKVDRLLVNGLISTFPYIEFMMFNWAMRGTYEEYCNRAKCDRDTIDGVYRVIIDALRSKGEV